MVIHELFQLAAKSQENGDFEQALQVYRDILTIEPKNVYAYIQLGNVLKIQGATDEAIRCYRKAAVLNPDTAKDYYTLGNSLMVRGELDKAIGCYSQTIALDPDFLNAYIYLGTALYEKWHLDEAIPYYQKAVQLNPELINVFIRLGDIFRLKENYDEAITYYNQALEIDPQHFDLYILIGLSLYKLGKTEEAINNYDIAISNSPDAGKARWVKCFSLLPIVYEDYSSIDMYRKRYYAELIRLKDELTSVAQREINSFAEAMGTHRPFYLAYQGLNDRELQQLYGELSCRIMAVRYPHLASHPRIMQWLPEEPLRIGFVSGFFRLHSNWKIPIKGWIENTDKKRFALYGYYTGREKDQCTEEARKNCIRFVEGIHSFEELCKIILDDNLHVLIYPEIGMDPLAARLAMMRLAPLQCTAWGHPETSGLPTIDYFFSSDLMEPPEAQDHYTEKLVRLPNLSIYYTPLKVSEEDADRNTFNLRENSVLYLCCQSLYKYLPQYDDIFPRIAKSVPESQFLFIAHNNNHILEIIQTRFREAFQQHGLIADDHIVFLPGLDPGKYHALNNVSDIYLDSLGWSGCNSTLEAIACNIPIITLPGNLMRGRHSAAILTMMGVTETIASTIDEYIELAVRLGLDSDWRKQIAQKIASNKHFVYQDKTCVDALEDFLITIVKNELS